MERLPYAVRMRNRCIAIAVFVVLCALIGSCIFGGDEKGSPKQNEALPEATQTEAADSTEALAAIQPEKNTELTANTKQKAEAEKEPERNNSLTLAEKPDAEDIANTMATITAAVTPENPPEPEIIDSTHIKGQKDVFLAEKIDNMLRRFKPEHAIVAVVDPNSNEIIAWGERKENAIQKTPDYLIRNTFPAASLAKTITIAAAMESNRYSLTSPIPMLGAHHTLYKNQLRVKENYTGPTIELQDAYAKSANPPLALIGLNVGAKRLREAAKNLGYNTNFPGGVPGRSVYTPPDSGYGLAEAACGFTEATTLTPLLAAAQVRAILMKMPLEIPWASNLPGIAPKGRIALSVGKFSENTYYGLKQSMIRSVTHGTARKNISTKHMARKNYDALYIGGKTGSLDGPDPHGRYEWFMGFAQSKEDPKKAIVIVIMQVHDLQGVRSQPATQVAGMLINYWAHQYVTNKKK